LEGFDGFSLGLRHLYDLASHCRHGWHSIAVWIRWVAAQREVAEVAQGAIATMKEIAEMREIEGLRTFDNCDLMDMACQIDLAMDGHDMTMLDMS